MSAPIEDSSIGDTLGVVGDRWTMLIMRDVFRGVRRFNDLAEDLGIARNLLSERLGRLIDHGVLVKVPYQERPARYEYRLTPKGADLSKALIALIRWGDRWHADGSAPTVLVHERCGVELELELRCPTCEVEVTPAHVRSR